ncbi:bicarbonate transporter permease, partial [Hapalosiphon sp. MRB220]
MQIKSIIAPAFGISALLIVWYLLSLNPETSLPSPYQVITNTWGLIIDPFFNKGGNNKG